MKRIVILGCAGCGKSTLAKTLEEILNLPVTHLDRLFWKPGWVEEDPDYFFQIQKEIVDTNEWIIDGNYRNSLDLRLNRCDMVIYLDFPRIVALKGIVKRYFMYKHKERDSMGIGCPEKLDKEFVKWVWNFKRDSKPIILNKIKEYPHLNVKIFKNRRSLNKFIKKLKEKKD